MTRIYNTLWEAEDIFYEALDEGDLNQLLSVWAESDDIVCLLPMHPMIQGRQGVSLAIAHLGWIETDDIAIHQVEETIQDPPSDTPAPPPFYGTNIYRKDNTGWRLIVHQNAPPPPPPEFIMPEESRQVLQGTVPAEPCSQA